MDGRARHKWEPVPLQDSPQPLQDSPQPLQHPHAATSMPQAAASMSAMPLPAASAAPSESSTSFVRGGESSTSFVGGGESSTSFVGGVLSAIATHFGPYTALNTAPTSRSEAEAAMGAVLGTKRSRHLTATADAVSGVLDCMRLVPSPFDTSPIRSPQAVHSLIARRVAGKNLVEIPHALHASAHHGASTPSPQVRTSSRSARAQATASSAMRRWRRRPRPLRWT
jgi:hypothetical protein